MDNKIYKPPIYADRKKMEKKEEILYKALSDRIICASFNVYNLLGRGFLEKVYENALYIELDRFNILCERQRKVSVYYRGQVIGEYVTDIIVENKIIVEIKATQETPKIYEAQLLNYLRATNIKLGYLLNFGNPYKLYFKRLINQYWLINK